jgi:anti-sigma regulatory factor (Ser/Thr protein kinase)
VNTTTAPARPAELLAPLPAGPAAAAEARSRVREAVGAWGVPVDLDDAVLLTSELVANAVLHGGGAVTLSVRAGGGRLRVDVRDMSEDLPAAGADPGADAVSGRGLMLVKALAAEWGSYPATGGGKAVFFVLGPAGRNGEAGGD